MGLGTVIARWALHAPDHPAVIDRGTAYGYAHLNERVNRLADVLRTSGTRHGDRVMVLADNRVAGVDALGATSKTGTILVVANPRWKSFELVDLMARTEPRVVIVEEELQHLLEAAGIASEARTLVIGAAGAADYETALANARAVEHEDDVRGTDLAAMTFTGGTTSSPKGVMYDADRMLIGAAYMGSRFGYDVGSDSRYLLLYPFASVGALNVSVVTCLARGATLVLEPQRGFDVERFVGDVQLHRITHTQMVPTMLFRLLDAPGDTSERLRSLRLVGFGSAPTPRERIVEMVERFGPIFTQAYGQSEAGGVTHMMPREATGRLDDEVTSCGLPFSGVDAHIVGPDDGVLPPGEAGEILLRSAYVSRGFWRDDAQTEAAFRGGWAHTGDLGLIDERGYLHLVGRTKDMIMSGGYNVASTEVESVLYRHPAVSEAAVIGLPDDEWGELVHAVVSLKPGAQVTGDALREHCRNVLASYKCPRSVEIRDALPKSPMGKILKRELVS